MNKSHLKIAICGVPGVKKTDLARLLAKEYNLPLIYQGTKEMRALGLSKNSNLPISRMNEVQRAEYQIAFIKYRIEMESQYAEYVVDACSIDYLAWYRMSSWLVPFDMKAATEGLLLEAFKRYDYVFYIPDRHEIVPDDRTLDWVDGYNIETVDFILKGLIATMVHQGSKVYIIQEQAADMRLAECIKVLSSDTPGGLVQ